LGYGVKTKRSACRGIVGSVRSKEGWALPPLAILGGREGRSSFSEEKEAKRLLSVKGWAAMAEDATLARCYWGSTLHIFAHVVFM